MTVYIAADAHGDVNRYKEIVNQIDDPKEEDIIIICGDAGLEYDIYIMGQCKKYMKKFPGTWLIMRGNHDARVWKKHTKNYIDETIANDGWSFSDRFDEITLYQNKYPNIHYIDDAGGIYNIEGYSCLFIPGAYSVDKAYRIINYLPYEYEEQLDYGEFERLYNKITNNKNNIDFVFAHTYPEFLEDFVSDLFIANIDQFTVDRTTEKWIKVFMEKIGAGKNFKHYFFGHLHDDRKLNSYYTMVYKKVARLEDYINE